MGTICKGGVLSSYIYMLHFHLHGNLFSPPNFLEIKTWKMEIIYTLECFIPRSKFSIFFVTNVRIQFCILTFLGINKFYNNQTNTSRLSFPHYFHGMSFSWNDFHNQETNTSLNLSIVSQLSILFIIQNASNIFCPVFYLTSLFIIFDQS